MKQFSGTHITTLDLTLCEMKVQHTENVSESFPFCHFTTCQLEPVVIRYQTVTTINCHHWTSPRLLGVMTPDKVESNRQHYQR